MDREQINKKDNIFKRVYKKLGLKLVIILGLVFIVFISQAERLANSGTFFGYKLVDKKSSSETALDPNAQQPSKACEKVEADYVKGVLGKEVERIGGMFADRYSPTFVSSCTYRTKESPFRTVTVILRDAKDEQAAKDEVATVGKKDGAETVKELPNSAYFLSKSNQVMTFDGKTVITVSVSKAPSDSDISSKDAAVRISKKTV